MNVRAGELRTCVGGGEGKDRVAVRHAGSARGSTRARCCGMPVQQQRERMHPHGVNPVRTLAVDQDQDAGAGVCVCVCVHVCRSGGVWTCGRVCVCVCVWR
eukprot:2794291-Rhodomonas_salina.1